jgi:hypothetical protein
MVSGSAMKYPLTAGDPTGRMSSPARFSSGCFQNTKLLKRGHAIVQADFFGNFAVLDPEHSRSGKPHLPAGRRRKGAGEKVADAATPQRPTTKLR